MRIITTHPITTYTTPAELQAEMEEFANIDGNNEVQVKHFQIYANKKGAKLRVNGKWTSKTRTAYARFGSQWEKVFKQAYPNYQVTSPTGKRRSGAFWDTLKNVWVTAVDTGLLDQGLAAVSNQGIDVPPVQDLPPVDDTPPITFDDSVNDEVKKHKWWLTLIVITGVAVGGYVVYKKIAK